MKKIYLLIYLMIIGLSITLINYNSNSFEYLLSDNMSFLIGDINNDGKVSSQDYILIRKHILKQITLSNDEIKRADSNNDNTITSHDYIYVRKVILENVLVSSITLNISEKQLNAGSTLQLIPTISPSNASNKNVTYETSNSVVASVDSNGLIHARHDGKATITVKTVDGNKTSTCNITVVNGNTHLFGWDQKEADKEFGPILDGIFTGKTKETIKEQGIGGSFAMHFPDMAYVNGKIYAYYITYNTKNGKGGVGLAISEDGINFENKGCVIEPDQDYDRNGAYFAGVWVENNNFYLVYESKGDEKSSYGTLENVALATSNDGFHWSKQGVIVYKNTKINWQKANVGTPDLYKVGNTWYLTFHGFDYVDCQIGIAYGTDLKNLTIKNTPIIPTENNTLHSGTTGRRDIIYIDGWYYMVYEISTDQPYPNAKWTHKFARSKDMINWTSVSLPLVTQNKEGFGYDGPCWVIIDDHIYVYFRDTNNSTTRAELTLK